MNAFLVSRLKAEGRWTEPPPDVPKEQWAYAILLGLTERYQPVPEQRLQGLTAEKAMKDLYG